MDRSLRPPHSDSPFSASLADLPLATDERVFEIVGSGSDCDSDCKPAAATSQTTMIGRRLARRIERICYTCATYFPLAFVYTLTTWSVAVAVHLSTSPNGAANASWIGPWCAAVALLLYVLLLWSYTTAVFSSPGSTTNDQGYSTIPGSSPFSGLAPGSDNGSGSSFALGSSLTVKANGETRFCKKCQARKPDRAHHCSSCRRCVLKMDHHCPWLANCIGLRNGKAFLLFLIYTSLFSLFSFALAGSWVWTEIVNDATYTTAGDSLMPIQYIMLCVMGGIIGLVVGLFTTWHIVLACRGQTTIECMEKTRYSSPLRSTMTFTAAAAVAEAISDGLSAASGGKNNSASHATGSDASDQGLPLTTYGRRVHDEEHGIPFAGVLGAHDDDDDDDENKPLHLLAGANSGATKPFRVPPQEQIGRRLTYNDLERYRAQKRHEAYLDQQDSAKLPHAFDLGVRRNLRHMFGPNPWLWALPICTTTGDGWSWEPSPKWLAAREGIQQERAAQRARERAAGWGVDDGTDEAIDPNSCSNSHGNNYGNSYGNYGDGQHAARQSHPVFVTMATPPRSSRPAQPRQPQPQMPPQSPVRNGIASRPPPSRYHRTPGAATAAPLPSKADRILGRAPGQYVDDTERTSVSTPPAPPTSQNTMSVQRLGAAGHALMEDDLFIDEDDNSGDVEDDGHGKNDSIHQASTATRQAQSQPNRAVSPLRARWLPDDAASDLLVIRKASNTPSPVRSPVDECVASPTLSATRGAVGIDALPRLAVVDDGSVD